MMSFTEVLAELAVNLRLDSSAFATGTSASIAQSKKLESHMGGFTKRIGGMLSGLAGGLAGGLLVGGLAEIGDKVVELGKHALEHAASLHAESQQLGVTTDDLQRYRFAAGQVGMNQEQMDLGLKRLNKSVGLADRGLGPASKAFAVMGINVRDAGGHLKTVGEIMPEIAGYISKLPDPAARAALEFQLFGRSGQDMAPLLNKGAEGIKNLTGAADKAGVVISPELIEKAHQLEVRFTKLKQVIETKVEVGLLTGLEAIASRANDIGDRVKGADDWLARLQARADAWDSKHGGTKSQFLGQFQTEPLQAADRWLADLQKRADDLDKRLGLPAKKTFIDALKSEFSAENSPDFSLIVRALDDFDARSRTIPADFERGWKRISAATASMASEVSTAVKTKLNAAMDSIESKTRAAGDWFEHLFDRVVGHSYVPDMVDGIAAEMARLDAVLVAPAKAATGKAEAAFRDLAARVQPLLDRLFPESAQANQLAGDIKTLNEGFKAGQIGEATWIAAQDKLFGGATVQINDELLPALQSVKDGFDGIGGSVEQSPMLPWLDKVMGALQGVGGLVDQVFGHKAGGIFSAIASAVGAIAPLFAGGGSINVGSLESSNASGLGLPANFFHRALGGPVVPGRTYMVGENGPEYVNFGSRGYVTPGKAGNDNPRRPYFDLRGAVLTADLLRQMNQIGDVATGRGALLGAAGAEERGARRARMSIP